MAKRPKQNPKPWPTSQRELERVRAERRGIEAVTREEKLVRQAIRQLRRGHATTMAALLELQEDLQNHLSKRTTDVRIVREDAELVVSR